ncbi:hypothetical protein DFQ26_007643 [Actinomortierella ambigua]|nr:hypothetical protein DFQ26_007643 [Actinomortierella ambigua]
MIRVMLPPSVGEDVSQDAFSKVHQEDVVAQLFTRSTRHLNPALAAITTAIYTHMLVHGHISPYLRPWQIAATGICIGGAIFRVWCYRELGRFFTYELSIRKNHQLVGTGPYRYLLHPSYTGMFVAVVAWSMLTAVEGVWDVVLKTYFDVSLPPWLAFIAFSLPFALLIGRRVRSEEAMLATNFGEAFEEFHRHRTRFIPFIF